MDWREVGLVFVYQGGEDLDDCVRFFDKEDVVVGGTLKVLATGGSWFLFAVAIVCGSAPGQDWPAQRPEIETGRLQAGEELYIFRVVACDLETREGRFGDTWEVRILGEGRHGGEDFFIEVENGRRPNREKVLLRLYKTALPKGWNHEGPTDSDAHADDIRGVQRSDGFEAVTDRGFHLEMVELNENMVRVVAPIRLLRLRRGHADALVGSAILDVTCSR